jgi:FtsH-binding integral membrane protein
MAASFPTHVPAIDERERFIARTYGHLLGAVLAFIGLQVVLFGSGLAEQIAVAMMGVSWLMVLGAFALVGWMASRVAHQVESTTAQYAALAVYVIAEALIFVPLIYLAEGLAPGVVETAGGITVIGFAGLTAIAFATRRDFSFLRGALCWGGMVALMAIVAGVVFGFELGPLFSVAMVAFAGAAVLYDTSNVIHHYPSDRHVAAALELFASVALMFWYVLRLAMALASED